MTPVTVSCQIKDGFCTHHGTSHLDEAQRELFRARMERQSEHYQARNLIRAHHEWFMTTELPRAMAIMALGKGRSLRDWLRDRWGE